MAEREREREREIPSVIGHGVTEESDAPTTQGQEFVQPRLPKLFVGPTVGGSGGGAGAASVRLHAEAVRGALGRPSTREAKEISGPISFPLLPEARKSSHVYICLVCRLLVDNFRS